jgi:hypothetical protein
MFWHGGKPEEVAGAMVYDLKASEPSPDSVLWSMAATASADSEKSYGWASSGVLMVTVKPLGEN